MILTKTESQLIVPSRVHRLADDAELLLLDVRTPLEFREKHASIARNVPLEKTLVSRVLELTKGNHEYPVYLMCNSGNRSSQAANQLIGAGFKQVYSVEGGIKAWQAEGLDVIRGKKAIPLERQVRIVAGAMVFIGAILAMLIHPWFAGISAFVGAGLVYAGVTDTCGMAMVLAKMPWNNVKVEEPNCDLDK